MAKATTNQETIDYFVIPQQATAADMTALLSILFPGTGSAAPLPGDVVAAYAPARQFTLVKQADWPTYATPTQ